MPKILLISSETDTVELFHRLDLAGDGGADLESVFCFFEEGDHFAPAHSIVFSSTLKGEFKLATQVYLLVLFLMPISFFSLAQAKTTSYHSFQSQPQLGKIKTKLLSYYQGPLHQACQSTLEELRTLSQFQGPSVFSYHLICDDLNKSTEWLDLEIYIERNHENSEMIDLFKNRLKSFRIHGAQLDLYRVERLVVSQVNQIIGPKKSVLSRGSRLNGFDSLAKVVERYETDFEQYKSLSPVSLISVFLDDFAQPLNLSSLRRNSVGVKFKFEVFYLLTGGQFQSSLWGTNEFPLLRRSWKKGTPVK